MRNYGRASVAEFLGDFIVYRNLYPMDTRLPTLEDIRLSIGLEAGSIPRKSEENYAKVIASMLNAAREVTAPSAHIERLVYIGDTRLNDGTAFINICKAGNWPGLAFIGAEKDDTPGYTIEAVDQGEFYLANRWAMLDAFEHYCIEKGHPIDANTAVVIDLDKTSLGARGRNDQVINAARVAAVRQTVGELLGDAFDVSGFEAAYGRLNTTEFHPFTTDNQDYLAYICLMTGAGMMDFDSMITNIREGKLASFTQFIEHVQTQRSELSASLREIHDEVYVLVKTGDPTPFKAFRYNEYECTVERLGSLADDTEIADLLQDEIVLTQEVRAAALRWRRSGALLFGLSDKPDEASIPTDTLAEQGYLPIHQMHTHAVGE